MSKPSALSAELHRELVRKGLHFLIALAPVLAALHRGFTLILLAAGILGFAVLETLRHRGIRFPVVSSLTDLASRSHDRGRFVLGPVTLGAGAFLSILIFPPKIAEIAVFALAFGDGFSSLAGKWFGRIRPRFLFGKSLEGSAVCFLGVALSAFICSGSIRTALIAAAFTVPVEALPLRDWDNVIIPLVTGFAVLFLTV